MKSKIYKYDFLILGAGLIGTLCGLKLIQKNFKALVVEKNKNTKFDQRTLAVNANSRDFLNTLGLWEGLSQEPINEIIIKDYINTDTLYFDNSTESMGSVIYNKDLLLKARSRLIQKNALIENVDLQIENLNTNSPLKIKNKLYTFKKIIISVGKNYLSNKKITKKNFKSNHHSVVGFFFHSSKHHNKAYEIFTKEGPLAVLPSPNKKNYLSTFIYSTKNNYNKNEICSLIKKYFTTTHGKITFSNSFYNFKISPHMSISKDENFFLIGDSLRSIHPVAGQGWNLGIKDIETLCELLERYALDDPVLILSYYAKRKIEGFAYLTFTSFLNDIYEKNNLFSQFKIKIAFQSLRIFSPLRNKFIKSAMGRYNLI